MKSQQVFVRQSTGLVREVGLVSGIIFNLCQGGSLLAFGILNPYFISYANGGNMLLALLIGGTASILLSSIYAHFMSAMPRSGGEYVFLSRAMHPLVGILISWSVTAGFLFFFVFGNAFFEVPLLGMFLGTVFPASAIAWIWQPLGIVLTGTAISIIVTVVCAVGMKWYLRMQNVVWILAIPAVAIMAYAFIAATGNFPATFNAWSLRFVPTQSDMYNTVISNATRAGFAMLPPESPAMEQTLSFASQVVAFICPFVFMTSYIAGEVKQADSGIRQHIMMSGAVVGFIVLYVLLGWTFINMTGLKFLAAIGSLGSVSGLPIGNPFVSVLVSWSWYQVMLPSWANAFALLVIFLSETVALMNFAVIIPRIWLAWSFDRMFPAKMAHVSDRFRTPTFGHVILLIVSIPLLVLAVFANLYVYIAAEGFWILIGLMIVSAAGIMFPYIRKDMYELMPLKARVAGIPLLSIISALALALTLWVTTAYFTNAPFYASFGISPPTIVLSILVYAMAVALYYISRAYWKRKGLDIDLAFRQIPPS